MEGDRTSAWTHGCTFRPESHTTNCFSGAFQEIFPVKLPRLSEGSAAMIQWDSDTYISVMLYLNTQRTQKLQSHGNIHASEEGLERQRMCSSVNSLPPALTGAGGKL